MSTFEELKCAVKDIKHEVKFLGYSKSPWECFKFTYLINGESFDYHIGIGHLKRYTKESERLKLIEEGYDRPIKSEELSSQLLWDIFKIREVSWDDKFRIKTPHLADIIICILRDAIDAEESFFDWCSNFGYDTDSRKALKLYLDIQELGVKMRNALKGDYYRIREIALDVEDY